jgi:hypothetical protein
MNYNIYTNLIVNQSRSVKNDSQKAQHTRRSVSSDFTGRRSERFN